MARRKDRRRNDEDEFLDMLSDEAVTEEEADSEAAAAAERADHERREGNRRKARLAGTAAALAAVALLAGYIWGYGSAPKGSERPREVTSVTAKVPAYQQLETMRESTISSLNKKLAAQPKDQGSASASSAADAVMAELASHTTSTVQPLLENVVQSGIDLDTLQAYMDGSDDLSDTDSAACRALAGYIGGYVTEGPSYAGLSPRESMGADVKMASAPVLSLEASIDPSADGTTAGGDVCVAYVPVVTDDGDIRNAVYIVGIDGSGKVSYLGYAGVVSNDGAGVVQEQVAAATDAVTAKAS